MQYQSEENERRTAFNAGIDKQLAPLYQQKQFLEAFKREVPFQNMTDETNKKLTNDLNDINSKIGTLESQKKEILNVQWKTHDN